MKHLQVLSQKQVFNHPWERIFIERVKAENGEEFDYLLSEPNDFVIVVPMINEDTVLLVKQYKHGAQEELLGFPAGFMNPNESPLECAKRELMEETGYTAQTFKEVARLSENPTRCRNSYYIVFAYKATPAHNGKIQNNDALEGSIEQYTVSVAEIFTPEILNQIKAGPMLSVLPFIMRGQDSVAGNRQQ